VTYKIGAIGSVSETWVHVIFPRSQKGKRVICLLSEEWEITRETSDYEIAVARYSK
jgi:hypothetical protein